MQKDDCFQRGSAKAEGNNPRSLSPDSVVPQRACRLQDSRFVCMYMHESGSRRNRQFKEGGWPVPIYMDGDYDADKGSST